MKMKFRTVIPKQLRVFHFDNDNDGYPAECFRDQDKIRKRKEQRDMVRDQNRPSYQISSPEYDNLSLADDHADDDGDWTDEENEEEMKPSLQLLDDSLDYLRCREVWMRKQQTSRLNQFNKNRPNSHKKDLCRKTGTSSEDDWSQFQSCTSLKSFGTDSSGARSLAFTSPKKGQIRNFIMSHYTQVDRISDIFVLPARQTIAEKAEKNDGVATWRDIKNVVLGFSLSYIIVVVIYCIYLRRD